MKYSFCSGLYKSLCSLLRTCDVGQAVAGQVTLHPNADLFFLNVFLVSHIRYVIFYHISHTRTAVSSVITKGSRPFSFDYLKNYV